MDFTYVEFPCCVDVNTLKAYVNLSTAKLPRTHGKLLQSSDTCETQTTNQVKSLRHLVLDAIIEHWNEYPRFKELPRQVDRNYILSNLDVNLPLQLLSAHIPDDFFWRKCYQQRWKTTSYNQTSTTHAKPWINSYMERHLQEFIENVETGDYDAEAVQTVLDICAAYINQLEINLLQPSFGDAQANTNDHIPLDFILSNLPELHTFRLTYCTKTMGINFYLGCNTLSQNDIVHLAKGLSKCYELQNFCFHSTKLAPYQLRFIARSLDKACHNLTSLSLINCGFGDEGIKQFLIACNKESFETLKLLNLTNNTISAEGAYILSRALCHVPLQTLVLRLNPIKSDGAAAIFNLLYRIPVENLDVSGCSMCGAIMKLFMKLIIQNRTLTHVDISNNDFDEEFGKHLYKIIGFNKVLQRLDLRNTGLSFELRNQFKAILAQNIAKPSFDFLV